MTNRLIIGLDLGGTFIKAVLIDESGAIRAQHVLETEADSGPDHVMERLSLAARRVCEQTGINLSVVLGIGVGSPGPLKIATGTVIHSANLPGWKSVPLRDRLSELTERPVVMTNDANAAAYGEYWLGAGRGTKHLCMLTLGTGVGGGVIIDGELLHGAFDNAGELGHMIIRPGGALCNCGQRGCLEAHAGSTHLVARARSAVQAGDSPTLKHRLDSCESIDVPDIIAAANQGDRGAARLWADACETIAIACVNLQHAFNPQRILLGGGMAAAGADLLGPIGRDFDRLTWKLADDRPEIRLASLANDAGAIGAAGWFLHQHERL